MYRNSSALLLLVLSIGCAANQPRVEKPRPENTAQPAEIVSQSQPETRPPTAVTDGWDGGFDKGLVAWGAEWRVIWDHTKQYKVITEGRECHWQAVSDGARSGTYAVQATIPVQPAANQEVHVDLWARYHFAVKPGQSVRISGWYHGNAEVRFGADFKTDEGPCSQVADIFSDWSSEAEWTQVQLDRDHPANMGGRPNRDAARLIVPMGAKVMAVWVQVRGHKGDQALIDDVEVTLLDQ